MRRLLTYHIQAQVGFMLAGIGIGSAMGIAGGFGHLFNNVLYKGLLFMVAGVVILHTGANRLDRFGAIRTSAPVTLVVFLVAALSITAVPGFNGFVSKGLVIDAAIEAGETPLEWLLYLGSVGTFASFIKFGHYAFLEGEPVRMRDASPGHAAVALGIAGVCVVLGVHYQALLAVLPATEGWTADPYTTTKLLITAGLAAAGLVAFVATKPLLDRLLGGIDVDRVHDPAVFYGTRALSGALGRLYGGADERATALARGAAAGASDPASVVQRTLPAAWEDRYRRRRELTPGSTGAKLGISRTIYVAGAVLALALGIAMLWGI
jgi:multicomponent Na+:H+ antiporter subunit D